MQRHFEEAGLVCGLDDAPEIHHRDPITDVLDHREVVGDEQVGQLQFILKVHQEIDDLGLDRHIERRHRLVADDQLRVQCERTGNPDALTLPARELVREGVD